MTLRSLLQACCCLWDSCDNLPFCCYFEITVILSTTDEYSALLLAVFLFVKLCGDSNVAWWIFIVCSFTLALGLLLYKRNLVTDAVLQHTCRYVEFQDTPITSDNPLEFSCETWRDWDWSDLSPRDLNVGGKQKVWRVGWLKRWLIRSGSGSGWRWQSGPWLIFRICRKWRGGRCSPDSNYLPHVLPVP
jgi:hypothetical protein